MRQLTEYSIAPDIHLYEVSPECYADRRKEIIEKGLSLDETFPMTRIKPNTAMTLSL
jgi:hypothetical protein